MEPEMRVKFALAVAGKRLESKEYEDAEKICDRAIKLYGDSKEVGKNARGLLFATRGSAYFAYRKRTSGEALKWSDGGIVH